MEKALFHLIVQGEACHGGKGVAAEAGGFPSHCFHKQKAESKECGCLAFFLLLYPGLRPMEMVMSVVKVDLSTR